MYRISPSEVQANRLSIFGGGRLRCGEIRALIDNFDVLQSPQRGAGMALNTKAKAQEAVRQLREAILEELKNHPEGLRNSDITANLELQSDYQGRQKNYLSWSILGLLVNEGRVHRKGQLYFVSR